MKNNLSKHLLALLLTLGFGLSGAFGETKYACSEIGKKAKASVAAKPSSASSVVAKLIKQHEDCVCSIVKGAIEAGGDVRALSLPQSKQHLQNQQSCTSVPFLLLQNLLKQ